MKNLFTKLSLLFIVVSVIVYLFIPLFNNISYGLDLKGGFEVLYQVTPFEGDKLTNDMLVSTYKTISKRIDVLGVAEPEIIIEGSDRVRVRLAGVTDPDTARQILSTTASLSFRNSSDELLMTSDVLRSAKLDQDSETKLPVVQLAIKDNDKFYKVTKAISQTEDQLIVMWLDFEDGVDSYITEKDN